MQSLIWIELVLKFIMLGGGIGLGFTFVKMFPSLNQGISLLIVSGVIANLLPICMDSFLYIFEDKSFWFLKFCRNQTLLSSFYSGCLD
jgi:hypothetical protein